MTQNLHLVVFWLAAIAQTATLFGWQAPASVVQSAAFVALMTAAHARSKQEVGKR